MKKISCALVAAAWLASTAAMAQATSLADVNLAGDKVYTVQTQRGGWCANATQFVSTGTANVSPSASDPNQQFAFVPSSTDPSKIYLYNVGQKKFVKRDRSLVSGGGDLLYIWNDTGNSTYPYFFSFTSDKTDYNINIGGANQMTVDTWNTYDAGNQCQVTEVAGATFDLQAVQEQLNSFSIGEASQGYQTTGMGNDTWLVRTKITAKATADSKIEKFYVTLKGNTASLIDEVRLYTAPIESSRDSSNFYLYSSLTPVATAQPAATVELAPANFTIPAGQTRYVWLTVKVKDDATFGESVDAAIDSITVDGKTIAAALDPAGSSKIFKQQSVPFPWWAFDTKIYRIPAMVQANDGTIVLACDDRRYHGADAGSGPDDIVYRYSEDGGNTWSDRFVMAKASGDKNNGIYSYGDPALGKAPNGDIILLTCATDRGFFSGQTSPWIYRSTDNGKTWDEGRTVNTDSTFTDNYSGTKGFGGFSWFFTSGRFITTSSGRMMTLNPCYAKQGGVLTDNIVYSDDNGHTWTMEAAPVWASGGNEAKVVERKDHTILASVRQSGRRGFNVGNSDGTRWAGQYNADLPDPGCNEDIIAYGDSSMLIHTSLVAGKRANLHIYTSHDQGKTWTDRLQIQEGGAGYSTMEVLKNGDLAIFFEDASNDNHSYDMTFVTIPKETVEGWVAAGTPTADDYAANVREEYGAVFADDAPTDGYFTLSAEDREAYKALYDQRAQSSTLDQYFAFQDEMLSADYNLPPTGYYRLANAKKGTDNYGYMQTVGTLNNTSANTGAETVIKATLNDNGTYWLSIQGKYIQAASRSAQVQLGDNPVEYTPVILKPGQVALMSNTSDYNTTLHMGKAQGYIIVGWSPVDNDASQWKFEDATSVQVSATADGDNSYAAVYFPFPVKVADGVSAATVKLSDDKTKAVTGEVLNGVIPAGTPALVFAPAKPATITLDIAADDNSAATTSDLAGTYLNGTVTSGDLTLGVSGGKAGFYTASGNQLAHNTAYIPAATAAGATAAPFDVASYTGISSIDAPAADRQAASYNLAGQRVPATYKGVVITSGTKHVVK